jgi:hypothetical protein
MNGNTVDKTVREVAGVLFPLSFTLIMGVAVAVTFCADGMGFKAMFMLAVWLIATLILWSVPFIVQKVCGHRQVCMDERSLMIFKNAILAAYTVSCLYFLGACLVAWRAVGSKGLISVSVLPLILVGALVVFQFALVAASLIQGRIGVTDDGK